jgi:hypothetical protein
MDAMPKYEFNKRDFPETGNTATPLLKAYVLLGNDNYLPENPILLLREIPRRERLPQVP